MPSAFPKPASATATVKRPGERRSLSRSATRALDVLELFGVRRGPLRAVEIGGALGLNPSSTNQILKTMVDSGHLVFEARTKTYLPSARFTKFGRWIAELYGLEAHIRDVLVQIVQQTGLVATVSSPNDLFMQIIDSVVPEGQTAERGLRISIFGSAIGAAYLSTLEDAEIARLATRARLDPGQAEALPAQAAAVRLQGFAQGPSVDGRIWSIAVPLPREVLQIPTVVGIAGSREAIGADVEGLVQVMRATIAQRLNPSAQGGHEGSGGLHDQS